MRQPPTLCRARPKILSARASRVAGSEVARLIAKPTRIDAGFAEFDGVTDQPAFEAHRLGLQMKLQAELRGRSA